MEGEEGYSVPNGLEFSHFSSLSSVSQYSAATERSNPTKEDNPTSEEKKRMDNQKKEIRQILTDVFQLANYYLVFQGVIFTSIFSSPSPLKCQYRWLPIFLSSVAAILNLSILANLILKYNKLVHERDLDLAGVGSRQEPTYIKDRHERRRIICMICLVIFFLFLAILLFASWKILCYKSGNSQYYNFKNCFELCNDHGRCTLFCLAP
ncbi:hypothetical protein ACH5RR_003883 [Cinchona calisaya]|uniref:Transmembrane protein n=1 Tax=Cinchona calisaya TaxID=153742 RepID=A0ABD3AWS3_9GENT